jgi:hypothetical protein
MVAAEDTEVRALVLARALQGRMTRAANGFYEAAVQAAETCEQHASRNPLAPDVADWQQRATYWRSAAARALDVVTDWEADTA